MRKLILVAFLSIFSFANNLVLQEGEIVAHTEIFGDSKIDPMTKVIDSKITMNENIESIKGNVTINSLSLVSDNLDRDKHMYEVLNIKVNPTISFEFKSIEKNDLDYKINGYLTLNGVKKEISSITTIVDDQKLLNLSGNFSIKLTEFNMEPPSLLFLTVRDQIDIKYNLSYTKGK
ncbi:MAG: YceI family protein [Arcobacter sp.]|nr:MAG: YceI family protein [Arcobacter sp.]